MTALVDIFARESELMALRLQEEELLAQQDALLAEQLALALALGTDFSDGQTTDANDNLVTSVLQAQLQEVQLLAGKLAAEIEHDATSEQEEDVQQSRVVAEAIAEVERWKAQVAHHDAQFARKLASIDDETWENIGDEIEEPLQLPFPATAAQQESCPESAAASQPAFSGQTPPSTTTRASTRPNATPVQQRLTPKPSPSSARVPGSAASGSASRPAKDSAAEDTAQCLSCLDLFPSHAMSCAGSDAPSSSSAAAGCGHYFCSSCLVEYAKGAVRDRKYPITCPMAGGAGGKGCKMQLSRESVMDALRESPEEQLAFGILEAEQAIAPSLRIYCPHKSCSMPLLRPEGHDLPQDEPTFCPACFRGFCPRCLITGWHHGYTCKQFQQLPAHMRSAEDAAMLQLSARQQWKQCPQCKLVVERSEGCNHMKCRCGCNFCYACGKEYSSSKPTADNVHGTPACGCPLFSVPEENDRWGAFGAGAAAEPVLAAPVPVAPAPAVPLFAAPVPAAAAAAPRPRPWRGGRLVSRSRCRYSASIYDCPQGSHRCWFWHDEDDE